MNDRHYPEDLLVYALLMRGSVLAETFDQLATDIERGKIKVIDYDLMARAQAICDRLWRVE